MRRRWMLAALILVAAASIGSYAAARSSSTPQTSHGWISYAPLSSVRSTESLIAHIAKRGAAGAGDLTPALIQHSEGTRAKANLVASRAGVPGNQASYLIAERGHFVANDVSRPSGAPAPRGSVLTLVVDASTGQTTDFGVSDNYPDLAALGPVTTDLRRSLTTAEVEVPQVTNAVLGVAYARLRRTGLRVGFPSALSAGDAPDSRCLPTVGRQAPRGGRHVRRGTVVRLRPRRQFCSVGSPGVPTGRLPSAEVPLFVGAPIATAIAWANGHGLYWQVDKLPPLIVGNAPDLIDNYRVIRQQPSAGSRLRLGIAKGGGNQGSFKRP